MAKLEVIQGGGKPVRRRKPRVPQLTVIEGNRDKELDRLALEAEASPDHMAPTRLFIRQFLKEMKDGKVPDSFFDEWRDRTARMRALLLQEAGR